MLDFDIIIFDFSNKCIINKYLNIMFEENLEKNGIKVKTLPNNVICTLRCTEL